MAARRHNVARWGLRFAAIVALATTAAAAPANQKDPPPRKITPQALDALARQYRDAGLPLPPADAPLTLAQIGSVPSQGSHTQATYVVGFKLASDGDGSDPFLMGTQRGEAIQSDQGFPALRPLDAARRLPGTITLEGAWENSSEVFPVNNWLAVAVQCHLRGYDRLAEEIFARGLAADAPAERRLTPVGRGDPRDSLAATAWNHWMNALCADHAPRQEILGHLEKLSAAFPALDGLFQRDYLASLRLAIAPGQGAPGSPGKLVDDLIDHSCFGGDSRTDTSDPGFVRLQTSGFGVVPTLIAHLDDRRLTRSVVVWGDEVRFYPRRVGEVVGDLIEDIAGPAEFSRDAPGGPGPRSIDPEAARRWWAKASAMGEETYMTSHVFPPNEVSLQIVAERYPQHLGEMYARILRERPETDCDSVLMTIIGCGQLPTEERRRILRAGVASSDMKCSFEAIGALLEFDPADADAALIEKLARWPTELTGSYNSQHPEAFIANFVTATNSAAVWQAFEQALFRASVSFRMEMLRWVAGRGLRGAPQDVRTLALLDLFLDDEEMRVIRKEEEAPGGRFAGYPTTTDNRRMSVRNFVAGLLGTMLDVKPPPGTVHDERWWTKYRTDTRAAIDQHARNIAEAPGPEE